MPPYLYERRSTIPLNFTCLCRKLSKYFIARAAKEVAIRQSEGFETSNAAAKAVETFDNNESTISSLESCFCDFVVFDRNSRQIRSRGDCDSDRSSQSDGLEAAAAAAAEAMLEDSVQGRVEQMSLKFGSMFESGNLAQVSRAFGKNTLVNQRTLDFMRDFAIPRNVDQEYDLVLQNDVNTAGNIQWYYFNASIEGESAHNFTYPLTVRFNIVNFQKSDALYNYGMKPVVYSEAEARRCNIGWRHSGYDICYYKNGRTSFKGGDGKKKKKIVKKYTLSFSYTFTEPDTVYFAHAYPYTYTTLQNYLSELGSDVSISSILRRRQLCKSLCGNRCDLLTITSATDDVKESRGKKAVIITARVHPGETNSSHMMQGIIDFLVSKTDEAEALRKMFVFKIVPMLNPDGVIHGNYRCSVAGTDLNRRYIDANHVLHPEITALKELIKETKDARGVLMYLDLHGHSRNKNAFFYGCDYFMQPEKLLANARRLTEDEKISRKIFPRIFPKILSSTSRYFEFRDCAFKVQKSKMGTGRVISWLNMRVEGSYTIELSFCGNGNNAESKILNRAFGRDMSHLLPPSDNTATSDRTSTEETAEDQKDGDADYDDAFADDEMDTGCSINDFAKQLQDLLEGYKSARHYTEADYGAMGRDLCYALLYFTNVNPAEISTICRSHSATTEMPPAPVSGAREGHLFLQEELKEKRITILDAYDPRLALLEPSIFSLDAIQSALSSRRSQFSVGDSEIRNVADNLPHRVYSEIAIRRMLDIGADKLDFRDFAYEDEPYFEENNDDGSDSDPSGDNLHISVILKEGNLGERAMNLIGIEQPLRRRSKSSSKKESDKTKHQELKLPTPVLSPVKKKRPPRIPIYDSAEKSGRPKNRDQMQQVLGTGSTQRFFAPKFDEIQDREPVVTSSLKTKTLEFNPQLSGAVIIPKVSEKAVDRLPSMIESRKVPKEDNGQNLLFQTLSARKSSSGSISLSMSMQTPLQLMSDRYRSRNNVHRAVARRGVLSGGQKEFAIGDTTDFPSANTISVELDYLALGMKARDFQNMR